jgi:hypothetical protein
MLAFHLGFDRGFWGWFSIAAAFGAAVFALVLTALRKNSH